MEDPARLIGRALRGSCVVTALVLGVAGGAPARAQAPARSPAVPDSAHVLAWRAREAAARDEHDVAVELARRAIARDALLRDQLSLLIADQLTWADRPAEAIPWYREQIVRHPGDREARLGLARALSWTDDLRGARRLYRELAEQDPDDEEAALGVARMDAWSDAPGAAARGYRAVLERHPGSREARRGLAAAENQRGLHRTAEGIYTEILAEDPDDVEAREGLARARWWMGEEDAALATLGVPAREEGRELQRAILAERSTFLQVSGARWTDADDQELRTAALSAARGIGGGRRLAGEAEYLRVEEPGVPMIDATRVAAGMDWRTGRAFAIHARAGAIVVGGGGLGPGEVVPVGAGDTRTRDEITSAYFLWDAWATWNPADRTRLDLSHSRVPLDSPRSLARGIRADVLGLGIDRGLADLLTARAEVGWSRYSDDNRRLSGGAELETGPFSAERLAGWVSAGASAFRFDDSPDHGYYSPETYDAVWVGARAELRIGEEAMLEADARLSSEREADDDRFGVLSGGGQLRVPIARGVALGVFARKSTSRFDTGGGYEREGAGVSLTRSW